MNSSTTIDHRASAVTSRIASGCPKPETGPTVRVWLIPAFLAALIALLIPVFSESVWYDSNWAYRKAVTIDGNSIKWNPRQLPGAHFHYRHRPRRAQADGFDLAFTDSDEVTKLDHELESFDNSTDALTAWVKVSGLTTGSDPTLCLYDGNAAAADKQKVFSAKQWPLNHRGNQGQDFQTVLHHQGGWKENRT
jgi:hypothetical protein